MKNKISILFFLSLCFYRSFAQDPVFSQFYAASLFLNPAFAADKQNTNFTANHKTYTNREFGNYNLSQISALMPFKLKFLSKNTESDNLSGGGVSFYREATGNKGQLVTIGFLGTIAHSVRLSKSHFLSMGIQGSFVNRKQGNNFEWGSQYVEDIGFDNSIETDGLPNLNKQFPTINTGIIWFMNNTNVQSFLQKLKFDAFAGISVSNLNRPNQSFYSNKESRLPMNWKMHGGLKFSVNNQISVFPNILWVRQNLNNQLNIGAYASIKPKSVNINDNSNNAIVGLWYRAGESVIASIGTQLSDFKVAVSYDFLASKKFSFKNRGKGALEISMKYTIPTSKEHLQRGYVYPSF